MISLCPFQQFQRIPFNTKHPIGFSVAIVIQFVLIRNVMILLYCFLLIGIATLPMLFPLTDDIKCDMKTIQKSLKNKRKRSKIIESLSQFVQSHADARQLNLKFLFVFQLHRITLVLLISSSFSDWHVIFQTFGK